MDDKPSLKSITLKNLTSFLMLLTLIVLVLLAVNFRSISIKIVEDKALAISEVVKAGITAHMKGGIMDHRDYFLNEIGSLTLVNDVSIVRSHEVNAQFGKGRHFEKEIDHITKQAFESKQPVFLIKDIQLQPYMRAIVPFIASSKGELNCLQCHQVEEGTVLGALDLKMDLTEYRATTIKLLLAIGIITTLFIVLIIANNFRTIQRYIQEPLHRLIKQGEEAYYSNIPINTNLYECKEFEEVAQEINHFTKDVLQTKSIIEKKNVQLAELALEIEGAHKETVFTMGVIEEHRSQETKNHTIRVTKYSHLLGQGAGLSEEDIDLLTTAAPLHDIGKLGIPDTILLKPGTLSDQEFTVMKTHTTIGYNMLSHSKGETLQAATIIAHQHHERWDGSGYPQGLVGEDIHIFARIIALVDVYDALSTKRIYKKAWSQEETLTHIQQESGQHFDPQLVDILISCRNKLTRIKQKYHE
ncbi:MAG: HD domain-containing protein [Candidatus Polarisedimenticolaceae bacterium]|nr:HD domain-containing protein [Candidatus Polarisedimenticolaceae bacterium]